MGFSHADYIAMEARLARGKAVSSGEGCSDESELHSQIARELKVRGWYFVRSRMDAPTTNALGTPDFIIAAPDGKTYWVEAKRAKGKLTREQAGTLHWLDKLKHRAFVVRSIEEFITMIAR